ncbi:MAG: hypothetical protein QOE72_4355, partial [Chloroflexota bacterium]|nr:hypothetical protein [Chloroflexota bacterium]
IRRQLGVGAMLTGASVGLQDGRCYGASAILADWLWDLDEDRTVPPIVVELRLEDEQTGIHSELHRSMTVDPWRERDR